MKQNQKGFKKIALIIVAIIFVGVGVYFISAQRQQESSVESQARTAIEKVLSQDKTFNPNERMPSGVKLISVSIRDSRVILNFSKEFTSNGRVVSEDVFSMISNAVHPIIQGEGINPRYPEIDFTVLVEGKSIY